MAAWLLGTGCIPAAHAASAVAGDHVIMGALGEASNLIPPLASDSASREISSQLFIGLLKYDKNLSLVPWAAESYEVLDNGMRLRFTLRKNIFWEDGVEMTAHDVEYTYKMMIDPKTPTAYGGDYRMIDAFIVLDRYSFEVVYAKPFARAVETWIGAILPRHLLENTDLASTPYARKPVGAGPFRFKEWSSGERIVLEANPCYFAGRPKLDGIVYTIIPDLTTMFLELKAGKIDSMGLTPQQYVYQSKHGALAEKFNLFHYISRSYTYLGYNLQSHLFRDVRVRRAIAHAIDKKQVIAGALLGQGLPVIGPYIPGSWVYNTGIADYEHSLEKAKSLLAEAGWTVNSSGQLRNAKGQPFIFTILTNQGNEQRIKTAVIIQSQLKRLGIDVRVRTVEWAVFLSQFIDKGAYDALIMGWTVPLEPDLFDVWHSSRMQPPGLNFMKYSNSELDVLIETARTSFDRLERKNLYDRAQVILHEEQPYCFLYVPYSLPAVDKRFRNVEAAPAGVMYNIEDWWVPPAEQRHAHAP